MNSLSNETRWSSVFKMVDRYIEITDILVDLSDPDFIRVNGNGSNRPPVPWVESSPFRNWVDLEKCQVQGRQHIDFDPSPFDPIRPQSIRPKLFDQKGPTNSFRPISFDPFHAIHFVPLLLSPGENATVQQLHKKLQDLNSITMELQKDDMDLSKVRKLFNAVVEDFPIMSKYLLENSEIIQNPEFENAIVKAIDSKPLDGNEQMLLKDFKKTSDISVVSVASTTESYAERVLKKQKLEQANANSSYEVSIICPCHASMMEM